MINTGCSKRIVVVDRGGVQYTPYQIEATNEIIKELYDDITVMKAYPPLIGLVALCNINYSTNEIVDIVGESFISITKQEKL